MSADERKDEGAGEVVEDPQTGVVRERFDLCEPWVVDAWKMRTEGVLDWAEIARAVGKDYRTVQKHVEAYSQTLAKMLTGERLNPLAEYLQGCYGDLTHQARIAMKAETGERGIDPRTKAPIPSGEPDMRAASSARKEVTAIREKIAAAQGVVTERKGMEHSGGLDLALIGNLQPSTRQSIIRDLEAEESGEDFADAEGS